MKDIFKEDIMQNPIDSAYSNAVKIAEATKMKFFLYLEQTCIDGREIYAFKRESIGGKIDEEIRRKCLKDMMSLTVDGNLSGITLLGDLSERKGGVRNNNFMAVVYGWDKGEEVDRMLSLFFSYCLENPAMLESVFFNYKSLEDRDNVAEIDSQLYGPYKHTTKGFYDRMTFTFSKAYRIVHQYDKESPHDEITICVLTPDPKAMISYIANNSGLIANDFDGGKFSTGLLLQGKRIEIYASPKAVLST
jgi:hypothetical protein